MVVVYVVIIIKTITQYANPNVELNMRNTGHIMSYLSHITNSYYPHNLKQLFFIKNKKWKDILKLLTGFGTVLATRRINNLQLGPGELHLCSHCEHFNASEELEASLSLTNSPHMRQVQFGQYQLPSGNSWSTKGKFGHSFMESKEKHLKLQKESYSIQICIREQTVR